MSDLQGTLQQCCHKHQEQETTTSNDDDLTEEDTPNDYTYLPSNVLIVDIEGLSMMRDILVEKIAAAGLRRPGSRDVQLS